MLGFVSQGQCLGIYVKAKVRVRLYVPSYGGISLIKRYNHLHILTGRLRFIIQVWGVRGGRGWTLVSVSMTIVHFVPTPTTLLNDQMYRL